MTNAVSRSVKKLAAAAVAGLALTAAGGVAHAAVYVVKWDPLFNPTFSATIGWTGSAHITVDSSCIVPNTIQTPGVSCGAASLDNASLSFFDPFPGNSVGSVSFAGLLPAPASLSIGATGLPDGMTLTAALTGDLGANFFPSDQTDYLYSLDFIIGALPGDYSGPVLALTENGNPRNRFTSVTDPNSPDVPTVIWTPEPGSLALVGLALSALWWGRRRATT